VIERGATDSRTGRKGSSPDYGDDGPSVQPGWVKGIAELLPFVSAMPLIQLGKLDELRLDLLRDLAHLRYKLLHCRP
jgi:hypothetical protein